MQKNQRKLEDGETRMNRFESQRTLTEVTSISSSSLKRKWIFFEHIKRFLWFRNSVDDEIQSKIFEENEEKIEAISLKALLTYTSLKDRVCLLIGTLLAFFVGALQPTVTLLGGLLENILIKHKTPIGEVKFRHDSYVIIYWYIAFGVFTSLLSLVQVIVMESACTGVVSRMRTAFLNSVLRQDATWLDKSDSGALSSKLADNVEKVREGIGEKWALVVRGFAMFISSCAISFFFDWRTTLIMIGLVPVATITMFLSAKVAEGPALRQMNINAEADGVAEEAISAWKTVAASNAQYFFVQKYTKFLSKCMEFTRKVNFINGFLEGLMFVELYFFMAGGFLYATISYFTGRIPEPGHVFIVVNTVAFGAYFVSILAPHLHSLVRARIAAALIHQIAQRKPLHDPDAGDQMNELKGKIEFVDVTFQYATRNEQVLKGVSLCVEAGQNVAFVGASGCGKSTAIGLISALYSPISGKVRIDDKKISMLSAQSLREHIGIVPQEPPLFTGSIFQNVALGKEVSLEQVSEVCKIASAHEFILKLDKGYDTIVGYGGMALSGGQKQRIGIARALLGKPKILLLDEATSALDTNSEAAVQKALDRTKRTRTTISIAHRLSSIRDSDVIFVFDKGNIVEKGTHSELLELDGVYAGLAKAQQLSQETTTSDAIKTNLKGKGKKTFKAVAKAYTNVLHFTKTSKQAEKTIEGEDLIEKALMIPRKRSLEPGLRSSFRGAAHLGRVISNSVTTSDIASSIDYINKIGREDKQKSWSFLIQFYKDSLKNHAFSIILAQVISLIRGIELPMYCYFQVLIYNALDSTKDTYQTPLIKGVILFASLGIFCLFVITLAHVLSGQSADICVNELRERVLEKILLRDGYCFEGQNSPSNTIVTLSQQPDNCKAALDSRFCVFSSDFSALLVCLGLTFSFCWQMGFLSIGICFILTISLFGLTFAVEKAMKKRMITDTTAQLSLEVIIYARSIQILGAKRFFLDKFEKTQKSIKKLDEKVSILKASTQALTQGFVFFCEAAAFALGIHLVYIGDAKSNDVLLASMCVSFAGWALFFMQPSFNDVSRAASASAALYRLLQGKITELDNGNKPNLDGSVEAVDVTFTYPSRPDHKVASKLSLAAKAGETIALVGESGCGKSTLIQLIERFYSPSSGQLKIGGYKIKDLSLKHLRNHIALVGQEPVLFKGTILENITLGIEGKVDMERVRKVAKDAHCADFIEALPLGYQTEIGDRGKGLSGGQKQRIAIARALIRDPKILLLDEATSALDTQSEQMVQSALALASKHRTTISIAHRLSTIQSCDKIYYIDDGRVMESGTHEELFSKNGFYAKLVRMQALST
ncbi:unnamed protein product, partial [Mesorhabditis belari]|uniref:Uncharacterized protein n=1 Tax=Mesorhabditis belari TaxID=2138241 RepID=A0AAF3E9N4_9BILA